MGVPQPQKPAPAARAPAAQSSATWLPILGLCAALGTFAFGVAVILEERRDAWVQAEHESDNIASALEQNIDRNLSIYDLSLQGAIEALHEPGIDRVTPELRQIAVFGRAASAEYLGSLLVLDAEGQIRLDSTSSTPHRLSLADRDYFLVHRERQDVGLFVSKPFRSRLRGGDASIAISRRISNPDGSFAGVVVGTMRLAYFESLFAKLNVGSNGTLVLLRVDGADADIVARHPARGADVGLDVGRSRNVSRFGLTGSGQFVAASTIDGVERLFTFRHIGDLGLVVNVAMSVQDIFGPWRRKAMLLGFVLLLLCGAVVLLSLLFRREMIRRLVAERTLVKTAATDALTELANRREFDATIDNEWRRAVRERSPISLLMIDADCFKAFNDSYGHQAGDEALKAIAGCIDGSIRRPGDVAARYGGEEFATLLPNTTVCGAALIAETIRSRVYELGLVHAGSSAGRLTVSIGVGTLCPEFGDTHARLVSVADQALFSAKRGGRNLVNVAQQSMAGAERPGSSCASG